MSFDVLSYETIRFLKFSELMELYAKSSEKVAKMWFYEKLYRFKKIRYLVRESMQLFQTHLPNCVIMSSLYLFNRQGNNSSKSVMAGSGRVGRGLFIIDINYIAKKKLFLFHKLYRKKSKRFQEIDCGNKLSTTRSLRLTLRRSQLLVNPNTNIVSLKGCIFIILLLHSANSHHTLKPGIIA